MPRQARLALLLAVFALAAAPALAGEPLLHVSTVGASIAGAPLRVELAVMRDGRLLLVSRDGTEAEGAEDTGVVFGLATPVQRAELQRALVDVRVGTIEGDCGNPIADFYSHHRVTWRGRGTRVHAIDFGADLQGCPARLQTLVGAVMAFYRAVLDNAGTLVYAEHAVLDPFAVGP